MPGGTVYDVCVVGLGAMGAAATYELTRRGYSVVGVEQHTVGHDLGSSHGESRIIRVPYFEGAHYVPLVRRALDRWRALERRAGGGEGSLLLQTGTLDVAPQGGFSRDTIASCEAHGIAYEELTGRQVRERFPAFTGAAGGDVGCYQKDGGLLRPERCVRAMVALARGRGAVIHTGTEVFGYARPSAATAVEGRAQVGAGRSDVGRGREAGVDAADDAAAAAVLQDTSAQRRPAGCDARLGEASSPGDSARAIRVATSRGIILARRLVITTGPWTRDLCPGVARRAGLQPERQVVGWFDHPRDPAFTPSRMPVFIFQVGDRMWYGFPSERRDAGGGAAPALSDTPAAGTVAGVKIGLYGHLHEKVTPQTIPREVTDADIAALRHGLSHYTPRANGALIKSSVCMFTMSRDGAFIVDDIPHEPGVTVACGMSGHGFKFAPVVGELVADLVDGRRGEATQLAGAHFKISRFTQVPAKL